MAEKYERINENRIFIASFLDEIMAHPFDRRTCEIYAFIKVGLYKKFGLIDQKIRSKTCIHQIGVSDHDIWIAATVCAHLITLVSADNGFSRMQQVIPLTVENCIN